MPEPSQLTDQVHEFLARHSWGFSRTAILEFCVAAGISVQDFGRLLMSLGTDHPKQSELARRLLGDASLHYLCNACRAFWA